MQDKAALFQAIISKFVAERDTIIFGINEIILSEYDSNNDVLDKLCCLFAQLDKVNSQIKAVQEFYSNILNLEALKKEEK